MFDLSRTIVGVAILGSGLWNAAMAQEPSQAGQVATFIQQLSDAQFAVRSEATEGLITCGLAAVGPVAEAIRTSSDVEVQLRGLQVLQSLADVEDVAVENAVMDVLDGITRDPTTPAARRAQLLRGQLDQLRRRRTIDKLRRLGATTPDTSGWVNPQILNGRWINNLPLNGVGIILNPGVAPGQPELVERMVLDRAWTGEASDLDGLKHLPEVVDVVLDGTRFGNDYLSRLALLPNLDRLLLRETTMDARGFQELAKLPKLQ
ncbi:MAG TPA: hypothetical protein VIY86_13650, partial [Pirellulaceae bacterium]